MNENRTVIYRKGRVAATFSVRDGPVELELGAFIKKGLDHRSLCQTGDTSYRDLRRSGAGGRPVSARLETEKAEECWPGRP
jgi:hypothetical protein